MEVIHRFNGFYPFSQSVQSQCTYLEVLKENLTQQQIATFRKIYKVLKGIDQTNLIKLVRIYKEQSNLHLLYEYFPLSLEKYVQCKSQNLKEGDKNQYKYIYGQFVAVITSIIDIFVKFQIKTDIIIQNFVVEDIQTGNFKLFVDPDAEFIGMDSQNQSDQHQIKVNRHFLQEFYQAEKKRIVMQFQEMLEKYFGKNHAATQNNKPNFIINGSKLVFLNHDQKNGQKQIKNELFNNTFPQKYGPKKTAHSNSPVKTQKSQLKRDLKQKTLKKLNQIKNVLNRYETKPPQIDSQVYEEYYPQIEDEIVFRPEQITNDKTALLQENQYLQSLENQIEKINEAKRQRQPRQSQQKRAQIIKQINQIQQRNKKQSEQLPKDRKGQFQSERFQQNKSSEWFNKNDCNSTKNDTKNNDRSGASGNSEQMPSKPQIKKEEKSNKYKMKIVTSHQIQIEGAEQPQVIPSERDVIEGIKSGKYNISDVSQKPQRPKTVKVETQQSNRFQEKVNKYGFEDNLRLNSRNSDITSKSKKINEIFQKINSKSNIGNQLSSSHHQKQQIKPNNVEVVEHPQDNYYEKIRQAKNKAQQVLKQYAKKKQ